MAPGRNTRNRPGPRLLPAAAALFALLIQALLPAAALAAQAGGTSQTMVICTEMGVQTVTVGEDGRTPADFAGLPCADCLAVTIAALPAPDLAADLVAYPVESVAEAPATTEPALRGPRAPPRPPSRAPPAPNA